MQGPEKNLYKEFENEKIFLRLENCPPPGKETATFQTKAYLLCHRHWRDSISTSINLCFTSLSVLSLISSLNVSTFEGFLW